MCSSAVKSSSEQGCPLLPAWIWSTLDGSFTMFASSIANSQRCLLSVPFPAWAGTVLACGGEQGSFQGWLDATVSTADVWKVRHREYARSGNWIRPCSFMPLSSSCGFVVCTEVNYQVSVSIQTLGARGLRDEFGRDPVHWTRYGCGSGAVCVM